MRSRRCAAPCCSAPRSTHWHAIWRSWLGSRPCSCQAACGWPATRCARCNGGRASVSCSADMAKTIDGFVHVAAGPFIYGPEETYERLAQRPPPRVQQRLELEGFWIGTYPVTYAQWKRYLDATGDSWGGRWWTIR